MSVRIGRGEHTDTRYTDPLSATPNTRQSYDRLSFSYVAAGSLGRYTAVFSTAAGTTINAPNGSLLVGEATGPGGERITTPTALRLLFSLGGFANLSGLKANSITVTSCWNPQAPPNQCPGPTGNNAPGKVVSVSVAYSFHPLYPFAAVTLPLASSAQMVISN